MITLSGAQDTMLNIITSVESGAITPEEAVNQLNDLKADVKRAGIDFEVEWTLADFQTVRDNDLPTYELNDDEEYQEDYVFEDGEEDEI